MCNVYSGNELFKFQMASFNKIIQKYVWEFSVHFFKNYLLFYLLIATKIVNELEVADRLAVSAVVVQDLKGQRLSNYNFSWDRMLNFSADSGIFIQYAHARLCR